jgi:hypothetical protein
MEVFFFKFYFGTFEERQQDELGLGIFTHQFYCLGSNTRTGRGTYILYIARIKN